MRLIYPADTFHPKVVDEIYADEFGAAQTAGLSISIFNFEDFQEGRFCPRPAIQDGEPVYIVVGCYLPMITPDFTRRSAL